MTSDQVTLVIFFTYEFAKDGSAHHYYFLYKWPQRIQHRMRLSYRKNSRK